MTLDALIELHRSLLRDELDFSPSQRTPPVAYRYDETERAMVPDDAPLVIKPLSADETTVPDSATQSTQVGMPMSARMLRYLMGPSPSTPWSAGLRALRVECRRSHPYHRAADRPYWRGSLCHQLVVLTVIRSYSVHNAATILRYDRPEPVLRYALTYIEADIDAQRARAERRAREDAGHGDGAVPPAYVEHHAPSPEHIAECPNPACVERRNAA